jgi:hypothetical protein
VARNLLGTESGLRKRLLEGHAVVEQVEQCGPRVGRELPFSCPTLPLPLWIAGLATLHSGLLQLAPTREGVPRARLTPPRRGVCSGLTASSSLSVQGAGPILPDGRQWKTVDGRISRRRAAAVRCANNSARFLSISFVT